MIQFKLYHIFAIDCKRKINLTSGLKCDTIVLLIFSTKHATKGNREYLFAAKELEMVYSNETERHPLFPDEALKVLSDVVRCKAGKGFPEMDEPALKKLIDEMSRVDLQDFAMEIQGEVLPPSVTIPHLIVTGERGRTRW